MPLGVRHGWDCPYGVCMCVRNGHLMLCVGLQAVHYMSGMCSFAVRAVCSRGQSLQYCGPSHLCSACHDYPASTPSLHLCLQNAATWRNRPRLPSKACKLTAALATKAYSIAGQAASALHAMAILRVHQAKALKCTRVVPTRG